MSQVPSLQDFSFIHNKRLLKNISISVGIVLLIWVGSWIGWYRVPYLQKVIALEGIPYNTAIIFETPRPLEVLKTWEELPYAESYLSTHLIQKWSSDIKDLEALFQSTNSFKEFLSTSKVASGTDWTDASSFNWFFTLEHKRSFDIEKFISELGSHYHIITRKYRGNNIYEITLNNQVEFVFSYYESLVLVGRRSNAVETSIEQIDRIRKNLFFSRNFNKLYKQLHRKSDINVYIGFRDLPILLNNLQPNIVNEISSLANTFDWSGLNFITGKDNIELNGQIYAQRNNEFWYQLSKQNTVDSSNIAELLPDNTALSVYFGLEDFKPFYRAYQDEEFQDFEEFILPIMKGELLFFLTNPTSLDFSSNKFVALRLKDTKEAQNLLQKYGAQYGELQTTKYQNFEIRRIASPNLLVPIFGLDMHPLQNPYYVIIDDFVIFCNSATALQVWIEKYNFDKKLTRLPNAQFMARSMSKNNHLHVFIQTRYMLPILHSCLHPDLHAFVASEWKNIVHMSPITLQMKGNGGGNFISNIRMQLFTELDNNLLVNAAKTTKIDKKQLQVVRNAINISWQYDLKAPIDGEPIVIPNPDSLSYVIAAKDISNRLYLFSQNGDLIWEKVFSEPIMSNIYGLDYHNTKNLQFIFNTKSHIYFIDEKGNEIKKIPLASPAATGMLMINYSKGVRLMIGCINGNIYGYDKSGVPLRGWNPKTGVGQMAYPPQFLETKDNAYLIAHLKNYRIGIFQFDAMATGFYIPIYNYNTGTHALGIDKESQRFSLGLSNGGVQVANTKGITFNINPDSKLKGNTQFAFGNFAGDKKMDYIRYSNGKVIAHYYNEKNAFVSLFEKDIQPNLDLFFAIPMQDTPFDKFGGVDTKAGKIYLYSEKGELVAGFPLEGNTAFKLNDFLRDGSQSIIVGNHQKLVAYKID